jgi:hypothetical protein
MRASLPVGGGPPHTPNESFGVQSRPRNVWDLVQADWAELVQEVARTGVPGN